MPEKGTFGYIDNDPLVSVTLINPVSKKKAKALAYLDTGSDTIVIPRELWLKLGLEMLYRSNVCAVGGIVTAWYTRINLEFFDDEHKEVIAFYKDEGDVLKGRNVLDKYSITFDGRNSSLTIYP